MATQALRGMGRRRASELGSALQERGERWREGITRKVDEERLATGLGIFSLGLGIAAVAMPKRLGRLIGLKDYTGLIRAIGVREIASGVGIFTQRRPAGWLWSRVGGDAMDLSLLGAALARKPRNRNRTIGAVAAVAGVTALDFVCSQMLTLSPDTGYKGIRVRKAITVNRPQEEVYNFWRNFQNLPRFMQHLESVELTGDRRSHWTVRGPAGKSVEWDAEMVDDNPNHRIAWRSVPGSEVENSGSVRFDRAAGDRGTIVRVDLQYTPPGGALGSVVAKLFGEEPHQQIEDDLRAFKQIMETGEITKSDASIHRGMHPGQPPEKHERTMTAR